jgi:hypothetical protein
MTLAVLPRLASIVAGYHPATNDAVSAYNLMKIEHVEL